jgi:hypothetical protein
MTFDQEIALIASIGALLTAIPTIFLAVATFFSVREMKQQRESSYRPEIVLPTVSLFAKSIPPNGYPLNWRLLGVNEDETLSLTLSMPLLNVGLGAAKNVKVRWQFPFKEAVAEFNQLVQKSLSPLPTYLEWEGNSLKVTGSMVTTTCDTENEGLSSLDYVLPVSIQKQPAKCEIPRWFIIICSGHLYYSKEKARDVLPARLEIEYRDIADKPHVTFYDLEFRGHEPMGVKQDSLHFCELRLIHVLK